MQKTLKKDEGEEGGRKEGRMEKVGEGGQTGRVERGERGRVNGEEWGLGEDWMGEWERMKQMKQERQSNVSTKMEISVDRPAILFIHGASSDPMLLRISLRTLPSTEFICWAVTLVTRWLLQ